MDSENLAYTMHYYYIVRIVDRLSQLRSSKLKDFRIVIQCRLVKKMRNETKTTKWFNLNNPGCNPGKMKGVIWNPERVQQLDLTLTKRH